VIFLRDILWKYFFIPLFIPASAAGVYFILKRRGKREKIAAEGEASPVETLFINLGATVGTGNITGVALAIASGGAGSIFWMWASALFGMALSYAENTLGVIYRGKNNYPVPYMNKKGAAVFSLFCILASFFMGNMVQSSCAADAAASLGLGRALFGILMAAACFLIIFGGINSIIKFTNKFVPFMAAFYIIASVITTGSQHAASDFTAELNGDGCSCNIISHAVARDNSHQHFGSMINGNAVCKGHTECDSIIMDNALVEAAPMLRASSTEANLIHEAAIGKIAGEQLIKLMTLGLTEKEAEEQVIAGFLR